MARFTITCPHCHASLELDDEKQVVVSSKPAEKAKSVTSMEERLQALAVEKEAAQAKLAEAFRAEKAGAEIREEKFRKRLEEVGKEPIEKPIRDIDLD
jgi:phage terminase large subunit GpA-like protein